MPRATSPCAARSWPGARARQGFTLIEVLVVLALLTLVMLALGSALHSVAQTQQRVDQRLARAEELRVAAAFIEATLGRVSGRRLAASATPAAGSSKFYFAGAPDALAWVGVMPARHGAGGRYFFRLAAETPADGSGPALVLRFAPWQEAAAFPDWQTADSRVLVRDLESLAIHYQGQRGQSGQPAAAGAQDEWLAQWSEPERLPERALLELRSAGAQWPPLVVALRQLPLSDTRTVLFSLGGGRAR